MKTIFAISDVNPKLDCILRESASTITFKSIQEIPEFAWTPPPNLLVCDATPTNIKALSKIKITPSETKIILIYKPQNKKCLPEAQKDAPNIIAAIPVAGEFSHDHLRQIENVLTDSRSPTVRKYPKSVEILLVGAGIVNLITALKLQLSGYRVRVLDAAPEPNSQTSWETQGCTFGGENARMFSFFETRNHFVNLSGHTVHRALTKPLDQNGWLIGEHALASLPWQHLRSNEVQWMRGVYNEDLIKITKQSHQDWLNLHDNLPHLFLDVAFNDELLRLYSTDAQYRAAIELESAAESLIAQVKLDDLVKRHPIFSDACETGAIVGALRVKGFTLKIHELSKNIIEHLRQSGATVEFDTKVHDVKLDSNGNIRGVVANGRLTSATHYVFSPGAYHKSVLSALDESVDMHAVAGGWLKLDVPIKTNRAIAFKLSRSGIYSNGAAEGANVFVSPKSNHTSEILISSVHGYVGENPRKISTQEYEPFRAVLEDVLKRIFPKFAEHYFHTNSCKQPIRYCHRPWTANCLGIFSIRNATEGLALITGGHNTGGFTQSAAVASAVLDAIEGRDHLMHTLYHPERESKLSNAIQKMEELA
ncbi:NAD(P)/FAD-dependent oxidoreductase [Burkholderia ubonensis]|uniref:NAD(P)/FAD-dependent oxidoreductase n=1 Tax=Burkholderia ubonensis TaxID=101571 RepID=UPI0009B47F5C|nr:FAD-binding oxidoreductase [Burkholderia ubonensis]